MALLQTDVYTTGMTFLNAGAMVVDQIATILDAGNWTLVDSDDDAAVPYPSCTISRWKIPQSDPESEVTTNMAASAWVGSNWAKATRLLSRTWAGQTIYLEVTNELVILSKGTTTRIADTEGGIPLPYETFGHFHALCFALGTARSGAVITQGTHYFLYPIEVNSHQPYSLLGVPHGQFYADHGDYDDLLVLDPLNEKQAVAPNGLLIPYATSSNPSPTYTAKLLIGDSAGSVFIGFESKHPTTSPTWQAANAFVAGELTEAHDTVGVFATDFRFIPSFADYNDMVSEMSGLSTRFLMDVVGTEPTFGFSVYAQKTGQDQVYALQNDFLSEFILDAAGAGNEDALDDYTNGSYRFGFSSVFSQSGDPEKNGMGAKGGIQTTGDLSDVMTVPTFELQSDGLTMFPGMGNIVFGTGQLIDNSYRLPLHWTLMLNYWSPDYTPQADRHHFAIGGPY